MGLNGLDTGAEPRRTTPPWCVVAPGSPSTMTQSSALEDLRTRPVLPLSLTGDDDDLVALLTLKLPCSDHLRGESETMRLNFFSRSSCDGAECAYRARLPSLRMTAAFSSKRM